MYTKYLLLILFCKIFTPIRLGSSLLNNHFFNCYAFLCFWFFISLPSEPFSFAKPLFRYNDKRIIYLVPWYLNNYEPSRNTKNLNICILIPPSFIIIRGKHYLCNYEGHSYRRIKSAKPGWERDALDRSTTNRSILIKL